MIMVISKRLLHTFYFFQLVLVVFTSVAAVLAAIGILRLGFAERRITSILTLALFLTLVGMLNIFLIRWVRRTVLSSFSAYTAIAVLAIAVTIFITFVITSTFLVGNYFCPSVDKADELRQLPKEDFLRMNPVSLAYYIYLSWIDVACPTKLLRLQKL